MNNRGNLPCAVRHIVLCYISTRFMQLAFVRGRKKRLTITRRTAGVRGWQFKRSYIGCQVSTRHVSTSRTMRNEVVGKVSFNCILSSVNLKMKTTALHPFQGNASLIPSHCRQSTDSRFFLRTCINHKDTVQR